MLVFKKLNRRPYWCPKPVLWEWNSFLVQKFSFFAKYLCSCWPGERKCLTSTKSRHSSEHNKDNMLIHVPQQDTGQHYGGRWARPSAVQRSRPLSQRSINLDIFVLSRKPPCDRVGETKNSKRNLKLPRIKQSYGQRSLCSVLQACGKDFLRSWKTALPWRLSKTNLSEVKFVNCNGQSLAIP